MLDKLAGCLTVSGTWAQVTSLYSLYMYNLNSKLGCFKFWFHVFPSNCVTESRMNRGHKNHCFILFPNICRMQGKSRNTHRLTNQIIQIISMYSSRDERVLQSLVGMFAEFGGNPLNDVPTPFAHTFRSHCLFLKTNLHLLSTDCSKDLRWSPLRHQTLSNALIQAIQFIVQICRGLVTGLVSA